MYEEYNLVFLRGGASASPNFVSKWRLALFTIKMLVIRFKLDKNVST